MTLVRFAPSPTGNLHLGNVKTAIINWLFVQKMGGQFMLRIDDTDRERSKEEYTDSIKRDLEWLGIKWDQTARQSERLDRYAQACEQLKAQGRLYDCYETEEELALKRKVLLSQGKPPIYDRAALKLTDAEKQAKQAAGIRPHWRFKVEPKSIEWNDLVRGHLKFEGVNLSDPVLVRADGVPIYTLASVTDDADFKVTHILRGEDHITNTAVQVQLFEALGATPPQFGHFSRLTDKTGDKLSKRKGSLSVGELREEGFEPMAIASLLARLGTADPVEPFHDWQSLAKNFRMEAFGKGAAKFAFDELELLNQRLIHQLELADIKSKLDGLGLGDMDEDFWKSIRGNLKQVHDAREWWHICREPLKPVIDDAEFTKQIADYLPAEPWDQTTWSAWTSKIKAETGRSGKNLFMPIRHALTGQDHGPELQVLLPLMGRARVIARLQGQEA